MVEATGLTIDAIVASPLFGHYTTIFEGINKLISYIAPPITTVFLLGVFWKRASGKSAWITLIAGMALGAVMFVVDWNGKRIGSYRIRFASWGGCSYCLGRNLHPEGFKSSRHSLVLVRCGLALTQVIDL